MEEEPAFPFLLHEPPCDYQRRHIRHMENNKRKNKQFMNPIYWLGITIALGFISISLAAMMVTIIAMPAYEAISRTFNTETSEAVRWYLRCSCLGWGIGILMFFTFWWKIYENKKAK